ncbi:MAG TPA: ester cyclase [Candidatus Kapabacteria bacterium]|nr:ester cyclase [Candidatus Kapabacteria bacterium]
MKSRLLIILAAGAVLVSSCAQKQGDNASAGMGAAASGSASNAKADSMKAAYKAVSDAWDAGNVDVFDKYIAVNAIDHNPMPGGGQGLAGMKEMAKGLHTAFPDMKSTIDNMSVEGDILTVRFTMVATNSGPMMGMPPTNKKVNVMGIDQIRWENGKFVEHWGLIDEHKMMEQLGMMPPPPGGAPTAAAGKDMKKDDMKKK